MLAPVAVGSLPLTNNVEHSNSILMENRAFPKTKNYLHAGVHSSCHQQEFCSLDENTSLLQ